MARLLFPIALSIALIFSSSSFAENTHPSAKSEDQNSEKTSQTSKTSSPQDVESRIRAAIPPAIKKLESQPGNDSSVSRRFLKMFEARTSQELDSQVVSEPTVIAAGKGISVNKPAGWVSQKSKDPNIVLLFNQAGHPNNRIEIRRGNEVAPSRRQNFLHSFRSSIEKAGFEPVVFDENGNRIERTDSNDDKKRIIGGLKGDYVKYSLGKSVTLKAFRGIKKEVGLILFLYENSNDAWIFVCYSTVNELDGIEPAFVKMIQTSQFDIEEPQPIEKTEEKAKLK